MTGRFAFLRESAGAPLDLAVQIGVGLPIGTASAYTNVTPIAFAPRIGAGKTVASWLRVGGEIGFMVRGVPETLARAGAASAFTFALSATTKGSALRGELTFRGTAALDAPRFGGEVLAGGRYQVHRWIEVFLLAGPGLGQLPGNPAFRVLGGVSVQPPAPEAAPALRCDVLCAQPSATSDDHPVPGRGQHAAMVALHYMYYNFGQVHGSLGKLATPAMAAGVSDHVWSCDEIAGLIED